MYNNIIYATEQEARAYLLPTSSQALFMDPTSPTFYVKATDAFGSPTFEIYDFTARNTPAQDQSPTYATKSDLEALKNEILATLTHAPTPTQQQEVPQNNG